MRGWAASGRHGHQLHCLRPLPASLLCTERARGLLLASGHHVAVTPPATERRGSSGERSKWTKGLQQPAPPQKPCLSKTSALCPACQHHHLMRPSPPVSLTAGESESLRVGDALPMGSLIYNIFPRRSGLAQAGCWALRGLSPTSQEGHVCQMTSWTLDPGLWHQTATISREAELEGRHGAGTAGSRGRCRARERVWEGRADPSLSTTEVKRCQGGARSAEGRGSVVGPKPLLTVPPRPLLDFSQDGAESYRVHGEASSAKVMSLFSAGAPRLGLHLKWASKMTSPFSLSLWAQETPSPSYAGGQGRLGKQ